MSDGTLCLRINHLGRFYFRHNFLNCFVHKLWLLFLFSVSLRDGLGGCFALVRNTRNVYFNSTFLDWLSVLLNMVLDDDFISVDITMVIFPQDPISSVLQRDRLDLNFRVGDWWSIIPFLINVYNGEIGRGNWDLTNTVTGQFLFQRLDRLIHSEWMVWLLNFCQDWRFLLHLDRWIIWKLFFYFVLLLFFRGKCHWVRSALPMTLLES